MSLTNDYRLQEIFSRACGSTAECSEGAGAFELGKYNHHREAYVLDVDECDATTGDAIDVYNRRLRPMPAAEAPIDAKS